MYKGKQNQRVDAHLQSAHCYTISVQSITQLLVAIMTLPKSSVCSLLFSALTTTWLLLAFLTMSFSLPTRRQVATDANEVERSFYIGIVTGHIYTSVSLHCSVIMLFHIETCHSLEYCTFAHAEHSTSGVPTQYQRRQHYKYVG